MVGYFLLINISAHCQSGIIAVVAVQRSRTCACVASFFPNPAHHTRSKLARRQSRGALCRQFILPIVIMLLLVVIKGLVSACASIVHVVTHTQLVLHHVILPSAVRDQCNASGRCMVTLMVDSATAASNLTLRGPFHHSSPPPD